jgi:DNA-nicking Smr family endonuclease
MAPIKDFGALKSLRDTLKAQEEERAAAEARRREQEAAARREAELFRHSIGEVAPLRAEERLLHAPELPEPVAKQYLADEQAALEQSLSDEFSVETLLETDEELSFARNGIGQDILRKLRRGHWVIQSQLDLHGMRTEEAREALAEYLRAVGKRGLRCVRIIHGKGLGSVNREPVLKRKVRNWLVQKDEVIAFCQARAVDGGAGAVVVLLKAQS